MARDTPFVNQKLLSGRCISGQTGIIRGEPLGSGQGDPAVVTYVFTFALWLNGACDAGRN